MHQSRPYVVPIDTTVFWTTSLRGGLIWGSSNYCEMLGRPLERLTGFGVHDFYPAADLRVVERSHIYALMNGEAVEGQARVLARDGHFYKIAWRKVPRFVNFQVVDFRVTGIIYGREI